MNQMSNPKHHPHDSAAEIIKIAILAVGGQGGGVLANWIADLGTRGGYDVQMTSVAGVAQRTGATIYYVEMAPKSDKGMPVMALSPVPGDVDILIASELMEAGRAVMRGFVTPDKTTLITSSHRILSVDEKQQPGDGRANSGVVHEKIENAALKLVCFDMEKLASNAGSVISSSLFGGLARSDALPFDATTYEEVIRASGRGVEASLRAFRAALTHDPDTSDGDTAIGSGTGMRGPDTLLAEWQNLSNRILSLPTPVHPMVKAGLTKVVDFQDIGYGEQYLEHMERFLAIDTSDTDYDLTKQAAKYIANAMCYDDILRVADLKTRSTRQLRMRREQQIDAGGIVHVTEYFHPRAEEFCLTLPVRLGQWIMDRPRVFARLDRVMNKGRRIRTDRMAGFTLLWLIARLRPFRRRLLRHKHEAAHLTSLIALAHDAAQADTALAAEILRCQRLVKGYSDTHLRARSKFSRVIGALALLQGRADAATWIKRLREAALLDEHGDALDGAIETVRSFCDDPARKVEQSD
ncbi:indolepyruvate oxidoreductase subunit beta family protein [Aliiroseovarius sp. 2305UL8-7]|uniref:indolepyruvate oxidoreductase subunit beta family protein n=1 Tax=Aliiroseovarius conchicola TaxID=3121637 RepID=UPI003526E1A1